jgi:hypothetical protein
MEKGSLSIHPLPLTAASSSSLATSSPLRHPISPPLWLRPVSRPRLRRHREMPRRTTTRHQVEPLQPPTLTQEVASTNLLTGDMAAPPQPAFSTALSLPIRVLVLNLSATGHYACFQWRKLSQTKEVESTAT